MPTTTSAWICFFEVRLPPKGTVASSPSSTLPVAPSTTTTTTTISALSIISFPCDPSIAPPWPQHHLHLQTANKDKDKDAQESWPAAADAASLLLDRMMGKNAPRARVPKTGARKAKGKGKAKAVSEEMDNDAMDRDGELDEEGRGSDDAYET
ncbi:hypothetical protein DXG01_005134 [Tephrocybe rancida]|nr:hypothetical protein DXG01_005134 [Tephrocybe rancida]